VCREHLLQASTVYYTSGQVHSGVSLPGQSGAPVTGVTDAIHLLSVLRPHVEYLPGEAKVKCASGNCSSCAIFLCCALLAWPFIAAVVVSCQSIPVGLASHDQCTDVRTLHMPRVCIEQTASLQITRNLAKPTVSFMEHVQPDPALTSVRHASKTRDTSCLANGLNPMTVTPLGRSVHFQALTCLFSGTTWT
jgi:hypothetical protein